MLTSRTVSGRPCPIRTRAPDSCWRGIAGHLTGYLLVACLSVAVASAQVRSPATAKYVPAGAARTSQTQNSGPNASLPDQDPIPVYQTWYFYLALLFLGITLPAQFFRRRMLLMKGRIGIVLEERSRIASECHDTLMAGFAAISWQLEATAKLFRDSGLDATPAAESCELARSMVSHCQAEARRIIWDLRETDEITSVLSQSLSRSLAAHYMHGAIRTRLELEGEEIPLAPGCVHHLTCIGQEAVTNAIRHSGASHILVHLKYESDGLCLSIRDDGRGLQALDRAAAKHGHFGVAVMQERARKLGGSFRIQGSPDLGTEVMVRVPFNAMQQPVAQGQHVIRWIGI